MKNRIKNLFSAWQANRLAERALDLKLEALVDPTFLDRALEG